MELIQQDPAVTDGHIALVRAYGDGHIRQDSLDYFSVNRQPAVVLSVHHNGKFIGVSLAEVFNRGVPYSITVVDYAYRNMGIGTALVRAKKIALCELGVFPVTKVAETNIPSLRMCQKVYNCKRKLGNNILQFYDSPWWKRLWKR